MSETILKDDGSPFVTRESAKAKRTRMGKDGLNTNIVKIDGGFALQRQDYEKPRTRIPLGTRNVLTTDSRYAEGGKYVVRVVNDTGDRIRRFRDAGWDVCEKIEGTDVGDPQVGVGGQVGTLATKTVGKDTTGYVMRIKKEYYEEDQETKAKNIRQQESDLKLEKDKRGRYGDIKIGDRREY